MKLFRYYHYILFLLVLLIIVFGLSIRTNMALYTQKMQTQKPQSIVATLAKKVVRKPTPTPPPAPLKLLFVGDIMLDRSIRSAGEEHGYDFIFSDISSFLASWDHVVANFESPVTDLPSVSQGSVVGSRQNYVFTTHPDALKALSTANISIVSIGNNHIGNFGKAGYVSTLKYLNEAMISYFGDTTYSNEPQFLLKNIRGVMVAFVNFNQFIPDGYEKSLAGIAAAKKANVDLIILMTHWDNEYQTSPAQATITRAHTFIDEGVDLIVGSHPHVVQSIEEYKGKKIYYSLGNFVFDQYFSPETMKGMLVGLTYDSQTKSLDFEEFHILTQTSGKTTLQEN